MKVYVVNRNGSLESVFSSLQKAMNYVQSQVSDDCTTTIEWKEIFEFTHAVVNDNFTPFSIEVAEVK